MSKRCRSVLLAACLFSLVAVAQADQPKGFQKGKADLKSAGPLAFGPEGVLFIGDNRSAAIFAIDTGDKTGDRAKANISADNLTQNLADMLATEPERVRIQDMAVNPASGNIYLSVMRGRGAESQPAIIKVEENGRKMTALVLDDVSFAKAALPNPPQDAVVKTGRRSQNNREFAITDMAFIEGHVIVAGLTNEDFASNLRSITYPFGDVNGGAAIEIFHGAHGKVETHAPVRTFVPITFGGEPQIIAAYTCTPLVRIPVAELRAGSKVRGTTIAELGNRNRPLDIIAYQKSGKDFLLMANDARGVMKISTDDLRTRSGITEKVSATTAGQPYETIESLTDVTQLDQLNAGHAVVLLEPKQGGASLRSVPLP